MFLVKYATSRINMLHTYSHRQSDLLACGCQNLVQKVYIPHGYISTFEIWKINNKFSCYTFYCPRCKMQQQEAKEFTRILTLLKKQCIFPVKLDFKGWKKGFLWLLKLLMILKTRNYYQCSPENHRAFPVTAAPLLFQECSASYMTRRDWWRHEGDFVHMEVLKLLTVSMWKIYWELTYVSVENPSTIATFVWQRKTVMCSATTWLGPDISL